MAVIITNKDCNISDTNAFYRVEAHNMSLHNKTSSPYGLSLKTVRQRDITFANSGTFKGFVGCFYTDNSTLLRDSIRTSLLANIGEVIIPNSLGFQIEVTGQTFYYGEPISFSNSGGALPTGLVAGTLYFATPIPQIPKMTSNTAPSGVASGSSIRSTSYNYWEAFDRNAGSSNGWMSATGATPDNPQWVEYDFGTGNEKPINRVSFYSGTASYAPRKWFIQALNTGTTWIDLYESTLQTVNSAAVRYMKFDNTTPYRYWRIYITEGPGLYVQITRAYFQCDMEQDPGKCSVTTQMDVDRLAQVPLNTTSAGSGTNYLWKGTHCHYTYDEISLMESSTNIDKRRWQNQGMYIVNFNNYNPDLICETGTTYSFYVYQQNLSTMNIIYWSLGSDNTTTQTPFYAFYLDNEVSYVDDQDTPIFAHYCNINTGTTLAVSNLGTNESTNAIATVICSNMTDKSYTGVCYMISEPTEPITINIRGNIYYAGHGGARFGSETNPITPDKQLTINTISPNLGTQLGKFTGPLTYTASGNRFGRGSLFFYGSIEHQLIGQMVTDALIGSTSIEMSEDMSLKGWVTGDTITIGKSKFIGYTVTGKRYTINSISGVTINLTTPINLYDVIAGPVLNNTPSKFGIQYTIHTTTEPNHTCHCYNNFVMTGMHSNVFNLVMGQFTSNLYADDSNIAATGMYIKDTVAASTSATRDYFLGTSGRASSKGTYIENTHTVVTGLMYGWSNYENKWYKSAPITIKDCTTISPYTTNLTIPSKLKAFVDGYSVYNHRAQTSYAATYFNCGVGSEITNLDYYGCGASANLFGVIHVSTNLLSTTFENIKIDFCELGFSTSAGAVILNSSFDNLQITNCNNDYLIEAGTYANLTLYDSLGFDNGVYSDLTETTDGTRISLVNYNNISKNDTTRTTYGRFQRCGDGLLDDTSRLSGTSNYSIRFQNTLPDTALIWSFPIPTGNIQNLTLVVSIWCKIKYPYYYADEYRMPTLHIQYDYNTNHNSSEALPTTDWQLLSLPITPTTDSGVMTINLETSSNAGNRGTVTITVADPAAITLVDNGFIGGEEITFSTDGLLPTGIVDTAKYFVRNPSGNTFNISLTLDGDLIETTELPDETDAQYGTHSLFSYDDVFVYFDDISIFYPPGIQLNLGNMNLWSDGLPITPPISTGVNANDLWAVLVATQTIPGTMGKLVIDTFNVVDDNTALIIATS